MRQLLVESGCEPLSPHGEAQAPGETLCAGVGGPGGRGPAAAARMRRERRGERSAMATGSSGDNRTNSIMLAARGGGEPGRNGGR